MLLPSRNKETTSAARNRNCATWNQGDFSLSGVSLFELVVIWSILCQSIQLAQRRHSRDLPFPYRRQIGVNSEHFDIRISLGFCERHPAMMTSRWTLCNAISHNSE
jgi:hypothetical protein